MKSILVLLVFSVTVYAVDPNEFDKYKNRELTPEEQNEVRTMLLQYEREVLLNQVNDKSYFWVDFYLEKVHLTLESFNDFFSDDADVLHLQSFVNKRDHVKYVELATKRLENAIIFVTKKASQDSYTQKEKKNFEIIIKDLTEARTNVEFLGQKLQECLDKFVAADNDEALMEKAILDLKNHALAKPFLNQIDHAIKMHEKIKGH